MSDTKMSEVFSLPLEGDSGFLEDQIGDITEHRGQEGTCITMSKAAAHAVNSHDKLVEMLEEVGEFFTSNEFNMPDCTDTYVRDDVFKLLRDIKGDQE